MKNLIQFATIGASSFVLSRIHGPWARSYLMKSLGNMPGLPAKFSQTLGMKWDQGSDHSSAPIPISLSVIKRVILNESPALADAIEEISDVPFAASLGQVHWARLKSGESVAIKVQYPGIQKDFIEQLNWLLDSSKKVPILKKYGFNEVGYRNDFTQFFSKELDYGIEAKSQIEMRNEWADCRDVVVPDIKLQYSTSKILVQSYETSSSLRELKDAEVGIRQSCADRIADFFIESTLCRKLMHADFQPDNWGFRTSHLGQLVLYDFGAVLRMTTEQQGALRDLLVGENIHNAWIQLGFERSKLEPIWDRLPDLRNAIFAPLLAQDGFDASTIELAEIIDQILGADKWCFRFAGPPWFLILMRSYQGFFAALSALKVKVNLREKLISRGLFSLSDTVPTQSIRQHPQHCLRVRVLHGGQEIVSLEMPTAAVENLELLVPDDVLERIKSSGIRLEEIKQRALASHLKPQDLFSTQEGDRNYRVWIA